MNAADAGGNAPKSHMPEGREQKDEGAESKRLVIIADAGKDR